MENVVDLLSILVEQQTDPSKTLRKSAGVTKTLARFVTCSTILDTASVVTLKRHI